MVKEGKRTERELALERDLKTREQRISELEDENFRLRTPAQEHPGSRAAVRKKHWLEGATFFEEDEAAAVE